MKQITKEKKWLLGLVFLTICFTVKNIFVGADIDEGYGVMVGYRLAKGDRLLLEMWEPHQTSAIFTAIFIRSFLWLRRGNLDFLNLYLRICYFLVQGCITVFLYRTIKRCTPQTDKNSAALMALLYYVTAPKHLYIPEYSNLQIWFTVLLMLCLLRFFYSRPQKQKWLWLLLAGCFLTCDVLAYPSMVLLYPCCLLLLFYKNREKRNREKQCREEQDKKKRNEERQDKETQNEGKQDKEKQNEEKQYKETQHEGKQDKEKQNEGKQHERKQHEEKQHGEKQNKEKWTVWQEAAVFTLPCLLGAVLFFAALLQYLSLAQIGELVSQIVAQDASHSVTAAEKCSKLALGFGKQACYILGCGLAAAGSTAVLFRKDFSVKKGENAAQGNCDLKQNKDGRLYFWSSWLIIQSIMQLGIWLFGKESAMYPQVGYLTVAVAGLFFAREGKKQREAGVWITLLGFVNYVGILLFSNWEPYYLGGFLLPACIGGCLCWQTYFTEKGQKTGKRLFQTAMLCFFFSVVIGHTYRIIGGEADSSLLDVRSYNREGFRKGIFVPYMNGYRYNSNAEIWKEAVPEGSSVLYVGPSQFFCMLDDCVIASPSTISSPTYEENLLEYWKWNPQRYPDEVVIECWYGDVEDMEEYAYLLNWLEQEYQPASVEDYPYIKVYRRAENPTAENPME